MKVSPDRIAIAGAATPGAEEAEHALEPWHDFSEDVESLLLGLNLWASCRENSARPALTNTEEMYPRRAATAEAFVAGMCSEQYAAREVRK